MRGCRKIRCIGPEFTGSYGVKGFDPTKILLTAEGITGSRLYAILMDRYHLQPEMAAGDYVLLMTSIMDDEEGFRRLTEALYDLERSGFPDTETVTGKPPEGTVKVKTAGYGTVDIRDAEGRISDSFIYAYPPGIPILMGGEHVDGSAQPILDYLLAREEFENAFPGYEGDIHGVERERTCDRTFFRTLAIK